MIFSQQGRKGVQGHVIPSTSPRPSSPFLSLLFCSILASHFRWYRQFLEQQGFSMAHHTGNAFLAWAPALTAWLLTRVMSSAAARWLNDKGCKNYTWVCARIPYCFCIRCFSEFHSLVTGLKFKCRLFPQVGQIFTCFSHIPRVVGGGDGRTDILPVKRTILPRGLKVLLSGIWGTIKQGGWRLRWLPRSPSLSLWWNRSDIGLA